ncbi:MAG: DUF3109 family protein [Bacteroidota bacterium]
MILIDNTVISDDIADKFFVCDLSKCKGACCVEGDLGAPLELDELAILEQEFKNIEPYLSADGKKAIESQGLYIKDWEDDFSTPTIADRECAYALYDEKGILKCAIEQAFFDGKTDFRKPISCHLYPIRITKHDHYDALNYDRWHICSDACSHGEQLGVELYKFLKAPLIRKYGEAWYKQLIWEIEPQED